MIKQFPEIDNFFKKGKFKSKDFEMLETEIHLKYKDKKTIEVALSIIKLKKLYLGSHTKYQGDTKKTKTTNITKDINNRKSISGKKADKSDVGVLKESVQLAAPIDPNVFCGKRVIHMCKTLGISTGKIISELKCFGFTVRPTSLLKQIHIEYIRSWLNEYLLNFKATSSTVLKPKKKKGSPNKKKLKTASGAWGKLQTYGMRGRLIYTR